MSPVVTLATRTLNIVKNLDRVCNAELRALIALDIRRGCAAGDVS
jgi:hypothetical protein